MPAYPDSIFWPVLALAAFLLLSGLDDLFVCAVWFYGSISGRIGRRLPPAASHIPERPIAIFVPLWQEAGVIGRMISHNIASIRYRNYKLFLGAYPNDRPTLEAVAQLQSRFPDVTLAVCPTDGPTSKADCLNWIYQRMLLEETERGERFQIVVTHDAEDIIHPESLRLINYYACEFDMVQVPVLPLPTPAREPTHGIYCDEFAEFQTKDIPARQLLGGFIPSNGVGTGYRRAALDRLSAANAGRLFQPDCLTEDYENGLRLHLLGCRQVFLPLGLLEGRPAATREYFPRTRRAAIRQRTRWVTGIALQGWQRHGWCGGPRQWYWLWRDRKGLIGNPVSFATNLLTAWLVSAWAAGAPGDLGDLRAFVPLFAAIAVIQSICVGCRAWCVARLYGWRLAIGVPARALWANWINCCATLAALALYTRARWLRERLRWLKTEHVFPVEAAPLRPSPKVARALPAHLVRGHEILPVRIESGRIYLAGPRSLTKETRAALAQYTSLRVEYERIDAHQFQELVSALL
ncbi:MAG: glycosyl transferase family protein [Bryobacteraceae bacterium]